MTIEDYNIANIIIETSKLRIYTAFNITIIGINIDHSQ